MRNAQVAVVLVALLFPSLAASASDDWADEMEDLDDDRPRDSVAKDLKASRVLAGVGTPMWVAGTSLFALHPPMLEGQRSLIGRGGGMILMPTPAAVGVEIAGLIFATASWNKAREAYKTAATEATSPPSAASSGWCWASSAPSSRPPRSRRP